MIVVHPSPRSTFHTHTHTHIHTHAHTHTCTHTHTHTHQASPLGHTTSSSSFVHPQLAQLSEHPRQSFIYTPPESGRQPLGIPPAQSRPRDQERRPGENGGVPRGLGQPSAEGPKMVRREREREGGGLGLSSIHMNYETVHVVWKFCQLY